MIEDRMSGEARSKAALALHRFGFGPRPGGIAQIGSDPRGALLAELERTDANPLNGANLLTSAEALRQSYNDRMERKKKRLARPNIENKDSAQVDSKTMTAPAPADGGSMSEGDPTAASNQQNNESAVVPLANQLYRAEAQARTHAALVSEIGFVERLTWFWSNHFCIAAKDITMRAVAGAFEREAIRPHVLGSFPDMLLAVESHPAMLTYLDNVRSIGPNSGAGLNRKRGLNENLAREILELHTLGVRTAYTQADVTNLAQVITGWSMTPANTAQGGEFDFVANRHEPGPQTVLGKSYPDNGVDQGRAVLMDLARHPATARHTATKLATHFVADVPPSSLVDLLAKRFLDSDGDLKEVAKALLESDEAWETPREKLKRPSEWIIGAMRAAGADGIDAALVLHGQDILGEPLWRPPSPKGFSDQSVEWLDGLAERLDVGGRIAKRFTTARNPSDVLDDALGGLASAETRSAIAGAEDRTQAMTLLFMAPEFQRR